MSNKAVIIPYDHLTAVGVVVGKVVSIQYHPHAERIRVARVVYTTSGKTSQIVFGGMLDLVTPGALVPVAPPSKSCRVHGKKMRRQTFRGVTSYGELLSLYELGLTAVDTDQVAILAGNPDIGTPIVDLIKDLKTYNELWTVFHKPIGFQSEKISPGFDSDNFHP